MDVRSAPAGQMTGYRAFGKFEGLPQRLGKIVSGSATTDPAAQKVRPQKLAERGSILGEAANAAQLAGETAIRIVLEIGDTAWDLGKTTAPACRIIRVYQVAVVEKHPEFLLGQASQIGDHDHQ